MSDCASSGSESRYVTFPLPAWLDLLRPAVNYVPMSAAQLIGVAGFYRPLCGRHRGRPERVYEHSSELKATLEELVDFDLINRAGLVFSGAVTEAPPPISIPKIPSSNYIRASGALPPGFPPVIDGNTMERAVTNTPINYVADERPLTTARIIVLDTFDAQGPHSPAPRRRRMPGASHLAEISR